MGLAVPDVAVDERDEEERFCLPMRGTRGG